MALFLPAGRYGIRQFASAGPAAGRASAHLNTSVAVQTWPSRQDSLLTPRCRAAPLARRRSSTTEGGALEKGFLNSLDQSEDALLLTPARSPYPSPAQNSKGIAPEKRLRPDPS